MQLFRKAVARCRCWQMPPSPLCCSPLDSTGTTSASVAACIEIEGKLPMQESQANRGEVCMSETVHIDGAAHRRLRCKSDGAAHTAKLHCSPRCNGISVACVQWHCPRGAFQECLHTVSTLFSRLLQGYTLQSAHICTVQTRCCCAAMMTLSTWHSHVQRSSWPDCRMVEMGQHDVETPMPHLVLAAPVLHKAELPPALYDCKHANTIQDILKGEVK